MTIQEGNIKLYKSQVMDDVAEGGGRATGVAIVDGASNSIFPDISELDRTYGRVNLMKTFVGVSTPDTDGYFGANVVIAHPPADPKVSCVLFTTNDGFDERAAASGRVESYLAQGPMAPGLLYSDHIAGQMVITIIQRPEIALPVNGDTYVLRKNEGLSNQTEQYVRVTDVSSVVRSFTDAESQSMGDFKRAVVTLGISDALKADFPGFEASRTDVGISFLGKTKFYTTIVADAARYYGAVPLTLDAAMGDMVVRGAGIFSQLVPSTRIEVPVTDARVNQQKATLITAGAPFTDTITMSFTTNISMFVGAKILPGSLTVVRGGITLTDKAGILLKAADQVGTVDYDNGVLSLAVDVFGAGAGTHSVTYTPAAAPVSVTASIGIPVSQQGQRLSWTLSLESKPARGSLQVSYRTLDRWYVITDDGSGAIRGADSSFGAGTINFTTGSVSLTLGALPDVGSQIIVQWVETAGSRSANQLPPATFSPFCKVAEIGHSIDPGSVTLTWNDGGARTASDVSGNLTGDATGQVFYNSGRIRFQPNSLPPKNTVVTANFTKAAPLSTNIAGFADNGATWGFQVTGPVAPFSFRMNIAIDGTINSYANQTTTWGDSVGIHDNGAGVLQLATKGAANINVGTINYATGACSLNKTAAGYPMAEDIWGLHQVTTYPAWSGGVSGGGGGMVPPPSTPPTTVNVWVRDSVAMTTKTINIHVGAGGSGATYTGAVVSAQATSFTVDELLMQTDVAPAGFSLGTKRHSLQLANVLVRDPSPTTGTGTICGSMGTIGGMYGVILNNWVAGSTGTPTALQGVVSAGVATLISKLVFRTAISPLFNGGFSVQGTRSDGTLFNVSPDANGIINNLAAGVFGVVEYKTGVITLEFGFAVSAGQAADPGVIDASYLGISGLSYMQSYGVKADTLRYNAVAYSYIPLDAGILGLDPVRLPADGRVPIFRKGGVAVVHNEQTVAAQNVANAQTVNVGRTRLSRVKVVGANNATITTGYTTDLDAGTVTFSNVSGYSQPVRIVHRVEDMALVIDAQINGQITLNRQLTHAFPTSGSFISSALIIGDMKARVPVLFDQATWSGNAWGDSLSGSAATATYNDVLAPLTVTNAGAITERWLLQFTNTTSFNIVGENSGVIGTGNTATDCAPNNPATGSPYFTVPALGWGSGWSVGNILRFNTIGALFPVWIMRTIQQGPPTAQDDSFTVLVRGDIDRP